MKSLLYPLSMMLVLLSAEVAAQIFTTTQDRQHLKSIQLGVGTQGIGLEFNYGLTKDIALGLGGNMIPLQGNDIFKISGLNSTSRVSARFYNVHLVADYIPLDNSRWLRLVGGVAYFFRADGGIRISPADAYKYGDLVLTQDEIGYVNMDVDWRGVAPYLGVGLAGIFPNKLVNLNFDLGTYYLSRPEANIIGTGILSGNSSQSGQLQSNIRNYRWLPVIQMNVNLKL